MTRADHPDCRNLLLHCHRLALSSVAYSPSGHALYTQSVDGACSRISWSTDLSATDKASLSIETLQCVSWPASSESKEGFKSRQPCMSFNGCEQWLIATDGTHPASAYAIHPVKGSTVLVKEFSLSERNEPPSAVAFHASDGALLAYGTQDGVVTVIDTRTGSQSFSMRQHSQAVCGLVFFKSEIYGADILASVGLDKRLILLIHEDTDWYILYEKHLVSVPCPFGLAVSADKENVLAVTKDRLYLLYLDDGAVEIARPRKGSTFVGAAFSSDGSYIYASWNMTRSKGQLSKGDSGVQVFFNSSLELLTTIIAFRKAPHDSPCPVVTSIAANPVRAEQFCIGFGNGHALLVEPERGGDWEHEDAFGLKVQKREELEAALFGHGECVECECGAIRRQISCCDSTFRQGSAGPEAAKDSPIPAPPTVPTTSHESHSCSPSTSTWIAAPTVFFGVDCLMPGCSARHRYIGPKEDWLQVVCSRGCKVSSHTACWAGHVELLVASGSRGRTDHLPSGTLCPFHYCSGSIATVAVRKRPMYVAVSEEPSQHPRQSAGASPGKAGCEGTSLSKEVCCDGSPAQKDSQSQHRSKPIDGPENRAKEAQPAASLSPVGTTTRTAQGAATTPSTTPASPRPTPSQTPSPRPASPADEKSESESDGWTVVQDKRRKAPQLRHVASSPSSKNPTRVLPHDPQAKPCPSPTLSSPPQPDASERPMRFCPSFNGPQKGTDKSNPWGQPAPKITLTPVLNLSEFPPLAKAQSPDSAPQKKQQPAAYEAGAPRRVRTNSRTNSQNNELGSPASSKSSAPASPVQPAPPSQSETGLASHGSRPLPDEAGSDSQSGQNRQPDPSACGLPSLEGQPSGGRHAESCHATLDEHVTSDADSASSRLDSECELDSFSLPTDVWVTDETSSITTSGSSSPAQLSLSSRSSADLCGTVPSDCSPSCFRSSSFSSRTSVESPGSSPSNRSWVGRSSSPFISTSTNIWAWEGGVAENPRGNLALAFDSSTSPLWVKPSSKLNPHANPFDPVNRSGTSIRSGTPSFHSRTPSNASLDDLDSDSVRTTPFQQVADTRRPNSSTDNTSQSGEPDRFSWTARPSYGGICRPSQRAAQPAPQPVAPDWAPLYPPLYTAFPYLFLRQTTNELQFPLVCGYTSPSPAAPARPSLPPGPREPGCFAARNDSRLGQWAQMC